MRVKKNAAGPERHAGGVGGAGPVDPAVEKALSRAGRLLQAGKARKAATGLAEASARVPQNTSLL